MSYYIKLPCGSMPLSLFLNFLRSILAMFATFRLFDVSAMDLFLIIIPLPNLLRPSLVACHAPSDLPDRLYTSTHVVVVADIAVAES